jgi:hypothetical protein
MSRRLRNFGELGAFTSKSPALLDDLELGRHQLSFPYTLALAKGYSEVLVLSLENRSRMGFTTGFVSPQKPQLHLHTAN